MISRNHKQTFEAALNLRAFAHPAGPVDD